MIISARQVEVFAHAEPVDMRKSFDTLAALVKEAIGQNLLSGSLFLFVSKNRKRAKVLTLTAPGSACSPSDSTRAASRQSPTEAEITPSR